MANTTKLTKAQKFAMLKAIPEVAGNPLLVEFIDHELELLTKKNSAEKKPTAQQAENQVIAQAILAHLTAQPTRLFTVTELMKEVPVCAGLTNQRVSAIVRGMIGVSVERVEDKRKAFFRKLP
jgi:acetoacetate decarboxylase